MLKKNLYIFLLNAILIFSWNCKGLYKAGNLIELGYPIETPIRSNIIRKYMDTLIQLRGYNVPEKWLHFRKLVDIDSIYNKRLYFRENPEEMYLISFGGMLVLSDVYNPRINHLDWVAEKSAMSKEEEERVKKRFKYEVLDTIETLAKRDGLPDSIIYKH